MKLPRTILPGNESFALDKLADDEIIQPGSEGRQIENELPPKYEKFALAAASLVSAFIKHYSLPEHGKNSTKAQEKFVELYNNGLMPELYAAIGPRDVKTLRRWRTKYLKANKDYRVLAPKYKLDRKSSVPAHQASVLIRLYLNPNRPLISEVTRQAIGIFTVKNDPGILSISTYRRFIEEWEKQNYATSVFYRQGDKALNDKCLPYIQRDYDKIEVGDIIVADGHVLNFEILNPYSGKPKRMMMILFLDMKSSMPLGWEIMPSENVTAIAVALYRSILRLGKYPKIIYIDNGRAFGARFFKGVDFTTAGITGLFERIGAKCITAWPYHAQSKTIERFFGTFAELERMLPTYSGTSIQLKPARMNRGERIHRKLFEKVMDGTVPTLMETHKAVAWFFDKYSQRPQQNGHLKNIAPLEIFEKGKGSGVDKKELIFLMMKEENKMVFRNGIQLFGTWYWHESLFGITGQLFQVRYDLLDNDQVYVFDRFGKFFCSAARVDKVHPAAGILGNADDVEQLTSEINKKKELKKYVVKDAKEMFTDEIYPAARKQLLEANIINIDNTPPEDAETQPRKKKKRSLTDKWNTPEQKKISNSDITPKQAEA